MTETTQKSSVEEPSTTNSSDDSGNSVLGNGMSSLRSKQSNLPIIWQVASLLFAITAFY